jgi:hypothetical protein
MRTTRPTTGRVLFPLKQVTMTYLTINWKVPLDSSSTRVPSPDLIQVLQPPRGWNSKDCWNLLPEG